LELAAIIADMSRSSLAAANRYLKDPVVRRKLVVRAVATSSAVEGIRAPFKKAAKKPAASAHTSAKKR
jgi:hypothetical protein